MSSHTKQAQDIRRAQKEATLNRELAKLYHQMTIDETRLQPISLHRVRLFPHRSMCTIFFYASGGQEQFQSLLPILILYKPSLRKALSSAVKARHTPDLVF